MLRINGNPPRSTQQPSQPHYYNSNNNNVALASCWFLLNGGQFYWIRYYNKTMFAINSWELWLPERRSQTSRPVTDNWYCLISHMRIPNSFSPPPISTSSPLFTHNRSTAIESWLRWSHEPNNLLTYFVRSWSSRQAAGFLTLRMRTSLKHYK